MTNTTQTHLQKRMKNRVTNWKRSEVVSRQQPFSEAEIKSILSHPLFMQQKDQASYRYWLPLLALSTGARLAELCQLKVSDVIEDNEYVAIRIQNSHRGGVLVFDRYGTNAKPIHCVLVRLGFLSYVNKRRETGEEFLFDIPGGDLKARSAAASRWISHFLRKALPDSKIRKGFYCFRLFHVERLAYGEDVFPPLLEELLLCAAVEEV